MRHWVLGLIASVGLCGISADIQGEQSTVILSTGAFYSAGDYGLSETIEDIYLPFSIAYLTASLSFSLTLPYTIIDSPYQLATEDLASTDIDPSILAPATNNTTESGIGDVIASFTVYDVIKNEKHRLVVDLTAKYKWATADANKGLGSGANDFSLSLETYKFYFRSSLFAVLGYVRRGQPSYIETDNVWQADLWQAAAGWSYRILNDASAGVVYSIKEPAIVTRDPRQYLSGFISWGLGKNRQMQLSIQTGLSDSSADWGIGLTFKTALAH